tara:strand:+ start:21878 stop:22216 length:339 start_codon:yes stop_codon:yes gene_type:complete
MDKTKIVPQVEFSDLAEFKKGENNFHLFFSGGTWIGDGYRAKPVFTRFQKINPELERELTQATVRAEEQSQERPNLPYEKLFQAYQIMSKLVSVDDEGVTEDGSSNRDFLTR